MINPGIIANGIVSRWLTSQKPLPVLQKGAGHPAAAESRGRPWGAGSRDVGVLRPLAWEQPQPWKTSGTRGQMFLWVIGLTHWELTLCSSSGEKPYPGAGLTQKLPLSRRKGAGRAEARDNSAHLGPRERARASRRLPGAVGRPVSVPLGSGQARGLRSPGGGPCGLSHHFAGAARLGILLALLLFLELLVPKRKWSAGASFPF